VHGEGPVLSAEKVIRAAVRYVRDNPRAIVKAAIDAKSLRFGVPIAALRWAVTQTGPSKKAPKDIEIGASPPAVRFGATIDAMGTPVRASGAIRIDEITVSAEAIRVGVRLNDLELTLLGESESPLATLIKSGALDLSKPGNLVKVLPKRPAAIVEAGGDRIVIDLLRVPALANNPRVRRALAVLTPLLGIRAIETDGDHLYVTLRATPGGIREALAALGA
jgi:hypothetical protein